MSAIFSIEFLQMTKTKYISLNFLIIIFCIERSLAELRLVAILKNISRNVVKLIIGIAYSTIKIVNHHNAIAHGEEASSPGGEMSTIGKAMSLL